MPDFALPDDGGRIVRLEELLSEGPVAIMFHRGHWCPTARGWISISWLRR
jgi:peroxiredoxin